MLRSFGPAANLRLESVEDPVPHPGSAIVQLQAAALNWHDVLVREGRCGSPLPHVMGADGAGVRVDNGAEVMIVPSLDWGPDQSAPAAEWQILGDRTWGTYAELVKVPLECLAPKPSGWSWAQAAAFGLVGLTAYRALFSRGRLRAGESLLVLGAGGGLATTAITLAAAIGATVVVTSSTPQKIERARELGASAGALYTDPGWPARTRGLAPGGCGFDVVLDSVGCWPEAIATLRPGGRLVVLGAPRAEQAVLDMRPFYFGQYDLLGTTMGSPQDFDRLTEMMAGRRGSGSGPAVAPPVIDRSFPLADAAAAHEYLESGQAFGKVVLDIGAARTQPSEGVTPMTKIGYAVDEAGVAMITLDDPQTRNALSDELLDELLAAFARAKTTTGCGSSCSRPRTSGSSPAAATSKPLPTTSRRWPNTTALTASRDCSPPSGSSESSLSARPTAMSWPARSGWRWPAT